MILSKKITLLTCLNLLLYSNSFAQLAACANVELGPDTTLSCNSSCITLEADITEVGTTTSYSVSSIIYSPPYAFNQGTSIIVGLDDVWSEIIPLPFNFCFFGNTYNEIVVGANGVITFDATLASPPGFNSSNASVCDWSFSQSMPNTTGIPYRNTINGAFHDIDPSIGGDIRYAVLGSYPCRTFLVNYESIPHYTCNNITTTQQIVLYETTNIIEVYIQDKPTCSVWNNGNAVIGIQNASGTFGYTPPNRNTGPWVTNNEAWAFSPNGSATYSINWFDSAGISIGNNDTLTVCPTSSTSYSVDVAYDICDGSQVIVTDDININVGINLSSGTSSVSSCNSYSWEGQTITQSGSLTHTYQGVNAFGCDSVHTLNVQINTPTSSTSSISSCDPVTWNGQTYTSIGTYIYTSINSSGCDSIVTLNLIINSPTSSTTSLSSCDPVTWNGQTYNSSGNYSFLTTNNDGCDSTANLNLTINPNPSSNTSLNSCIPITWNGQTYSSSGNYSFLTTNSNGCDSTANLSLTINSTSSSSTTINSCLPITWNGQCYSSSGNYSFLTTDSNGCDSTANLSLIIGTISSSTMSAIECGSYNWNSQTYTSTGTYTYTSTNSSGCDSIVTLNLIINVPTSSSSSFSSCDPFTWNGQTYSISGNYSFLTTNSNGCDSTTNLNLTIEPVSSSNTSLNSCIPITWNGQTYSSSGNYSFLTISSNGCDSIANLSLNIGSSVTTNISVDACNKYYWNGINYENSGVYSYTTTNNLGCDSTTVLILNVFDDKIFIPNTFTPNKPDNINDRFYIHNNLTKFKMWIYNRWGEEIFYTEDGQLEWDGKYKNKICQDGLYIWMIEFVCGEKTKKETGIINIFK